ncbi:cyanide hydratase/nitrilase-like protein [Cucurbitaria berberidis CBS 394.84]|uniref:nitrilase n=1 Tax=Cucurbitaria berberidis CBS 394.84 TaxID=1168544 RepID=A0A9P4GFC3_9PLEO|nr:cyanide hydratase/nitrilase-like protein [Cucurbitaria berberidis CBS 394.84]KAF1844530.1 cyanide hydratase/nitrilase-like protein [Cucurbitaria berberidis CBS 394.84]
MTDVVKVAVTQHEPIWFDLAGTVDKTCRLIEEAARNGAQLIAFPEVWIMGYPAWIWARSLDSRLATSYIKNSLSYESPEMHKICAAARSSKIAVVLGFSENDHNSLYISQCIVSATGEVLMKHRKFKPTHMERTVFGDAGGSSLHNVVDVEGVGKVGALSCWEHMQPLLKYHTTSLREQIHVAAWPPLFPFEEGGEGLYSLSAEGCAALSQAHAMESSTFVLHCTAVMSSAGIEAHKTAGNFLFGQPGGGQSAVYGPDGRRLTKPIPQEEEGFIYAELPLDMLVSMRHLADPIGHYSRPELLWLGVDTREKKHVRREGGEEQQEKGELKKVVHGADGFEHVRV